MTKINVLFHGDKEKFKHVKGLFPSDKFSFHHINDLSFTESQIIDKNPKIVFISILKQQKLNDIPAQVLEKQRHMSYYFLIAILSEDTEYMKELILKSGFDDVILEPFTKETAERIEGLITTPRREIRAILVQGWAIENEDKSFFFAKSRDLSRSGMMFEASKDLSLGQEVKVSFVMPIIKENITVTGKIVRRIPPGAQGEYTRYALNFVNIPRYSQKVLDQFFHEEQVDEGKSDKDSMSKM